MAEGKSLATAVRERSSVSMKTVMAWFLQDEALKNGYAGGPTLSRRSVRR